MSEPKDKAEAKTTATEKRALWAGRMAAEVDPLVQRYTRSIHFDKRLALHDIRGSRAHVGMLAAQHIISEDDCQAILDGLDKIEDEIRKGAFPYRDELEDIHMNIESRLHEIAGEAGRHIHTARSRNDQVALDLKLFCLETTERWRESILEVLKEMVKRADEYKLDLYPAWTHLQAAQPLSWAHYLLGFAEMQRRDFQRLESFSKTHSVSPLGAGALSGTSLPIDPERTAEALGFDRSFGNSYDVVGDRDSLLELLQIATQIMIHLSRMAEDFIYFASTPVGWIDLPDSLCTGSSMMPQKKNPDALELMRGKTASVIGHANALAVLLKGLPTSYQRDLQQDKLHLFEAVDITTESLEILIVLVRGLELRTDRSNAALRGGFLMATELAEYLVDQGIPFRLAHEKVGKLVGTCISKNKNLEELTAAELQAEIPECGPEAVSVLEFKQVLKSRTHKGSTGIESIEAQLDRWRDWISESR